MPLPPDFVEKKGVKIADNSFGEIPGPLSVIVIYTLPSVSKASTETMASACPSIACNALRIKLIRASTIKFWSACTVKASAEEKRIRSLPASAHNNRSIFRNKEVIGTVSEEDVIEVDATFDDKNSFEEGMAMLSENQEHDYSVLEKEQSDYSVLDKVGDGLMIAAKLASTLVGARVFSF